MKKSLWIVSLVGLLLVTAYMFIMFGHDKGDNPQTSSNNHVHTFGEWTIVEDATCNFKGKQERSCSCGEKETQKIDAFGHTEVVDVAVEPTCNTDGKTEGKHCSTCGTILVAQRKISARHTDGEWVVDTNATCTEDGSKHQVCSVCNVSIRTEAIAAMGHYYTSIASKENCQNNATSKTSCAICGNEWYLNVEQIIFSVQYYHVYQDGYDYYWLEIYNVNGGLPVYENNQLIPKIYSIKIKNLYADTVDVFTNIQEVTGSCRPIMMWTTGASYYQIEVSDGYVTHAYTTNYYYPNCVMVEPPVPHDYESIVTEPTKTEDGYTTHTCTICGGGYVDTYTNAIGSRGLSYNINDDGTTCMITGMGTCEDEEVYIPKYIDGYQVTAIGERAFENCSSVTAIVLSSNIRTIGRRAFYGCTGLTDFTIPSSIQSIGVQVFYKCNNLSTVYYNSTFSPAQDEGFLNTSSIKKVVFNGSYVPANICYGCSALTDIEILSNVKSIRGYAFANCSNLINVSFDIEALTMNVGDDRNQFKNCTSLETIVLPEGLTDLHHYTFEGCTNLKNITIPSTLNCLGDRPFWSCNSLKNVYISSIEAYCKINYYTEDQAESCPMSYAEHIYLNGELITELAIPDTVTRIPNYAFNSVDIKRVIISDSVISIGKYAFNNCKDTIVIIPDSVSYIGRDAFGNKDGNLTIYCVAESKPVGWDANWTNKYNTVVWGYTE